MFLKTGEDGIVYIPFIMDFNFPSEQMKTGNGGSFSHERLRLNLAGTSTNKDKLSYSLRDSGLLRRLQIIKICYKQFV